MSSDVIQQDRQRALMIRAPYTPYGAALQLWGCKDDEILMDGPAGTGKTRAILEKAHFCCMKYPGCRVLLIRKTRESLTESALVTFEEKVVPEDDDILRGPYRNLRQNYRYPNGSVMVVGGMDKTTKIMSTEYDMICIFEATELTEEDFESLTTRLRNGMIPYQQIIADCNPSSPNHWLNKRAGTKRMTRLLSRHKDNPTLFDHKANKWTPKGEKYLSKLGNLSGVRKLRLLNGVWAAAEGLVYEEFNPDLHLVEKFAPPPYWSRIRSIDFGYKNPFVCQWWAIDPDGDMYLYREIYMSHRLVEDHARQILELSKYERFEATICDHDAEGRATLERYLECSTLPAFKDIESGIQAAQSRIRPNAKTGKPSLYVMRNILVEEDEILVESAKPRKTADEFEGYQYPKGDDGKPVKEEPIKKDDHGMDPMRYAVAYLDGINGMSVKVEGAEASVVES